MFENPPEALNLTSPVLPRMTHVLARSIICGTGHLRLFIDPTSGILIANKLLQFYNTWDISRHFCARNLSEHQRMNKMQYPILSLFWHFLYTFLHRLHCLTLILLSYLKILFSLVINYWENGYCLDAFNA